MKSARHYFIIAIYEPKVVYDMEINTTSVMTSFLPEELIQGKIYICFSIGGTVDGKLERNQFPTASNLSEPRERQAYFTMRTSIPIPDWKNAFLIKIIFRAKIKTRLLVIELRNKRGAMIKNHTSV